jgi:hypothetical protein
MSRWKSRKPPQHLVTPGPDHLIGFPVYILVRYRRDRRPIAPIILNRGGGRPGH